VEAPRESSAAIPYVIPSQETYLISLRHRLVRIFCVKMVSHPDRETSNPPPSAQGRARLHGGRTHLGTDIRNLFDRAALSGTPVLCSDDETVGALAEFLVERIILIDDERLLERSERVGKEEGGNKSRAAGWQCFPSWLSLSLLCAVVVNVPQSIPTMVLSR
ncbi:7402_t:CDS:2, partial [Acaulospora colombiana]